MYRERLPLNVLQRVVMAVLLACSGLVYAAEVLPPPPPVIPMLVRMRAPEAKLPIRLQKVEVNTEVVGRAAHTRIEMVFFNPNQRALEGELQFPLQEGQTVSGFALDINGELRSAVPVEKEKGQQVFEDVIRARVDPALLEKTAGNNYKLRVYPLPAQGTRRVVLELDEALPELRSSYLTYRMPLQFASAVEHLDVSVHNATSPTTYSAMMVKATLGAEQLKVAYEFDKKGRSGSLVNLARSHYTGKESLNIEFPNNGLPLVASERRDDQTYFYAELQTNPGKPVPRSAPKKLGIVWDASGSGAARDHGREFALLDAYFKALNNVEVALVLARDTSETPQKFSIKNGDWHSLRSALEHVAYDGATNAAALSPPFQGEGKGGDGLNLLFSDGLTNFGSGEFVSGNAPVFAVNAVASNDLPRLRGWAEKSGGRLLDLLSISVAQAVDALTHRSPHLVGISSNGAKELVSSSTFSESGALMLAGILTQAETSIELDWEAADGMHQHQRIKLKDLPATTLAANRWAALKLAQLETDYSANRAAIQRLGKQFRMLTRGTSLIVLDRVEDYVRYEIAPPEGLRAEYERQISEKVANEKSQHRQHLDEVAGKFEEKKTWWEKKFPKGEMPKPKSQSESQHHGGSSWFSRLFGLAGSAPTADAIGRITERELEARDRAEADAARQSARAQAEPLAMSAAPVLTMSLPPPEYAGSASNQSSAPAKSSAAAIHLKKWEPDAAYAKRLRQAAPDQLYSIYLDERPAYTESTAFFLDAVDIFIERGQSQLGLRILSNLAEMNLENRHILRILAYRLLQAKQAKLAVPILQRVAELSPNEPQSWRDLGLALEQDGQYQAAADNLWEVVAREWDSRFPDIELIALNELNAIIARAPKGSIDTSRMDSRLLRNLPLDIRAVLAWDSDNADIDLWVTDPNGERVYYAFPLSNQGGRISRDFTGGYGPEEFSLREAKPGIYKVQSHFFGNRQQIVSGSTTLMLRFSTGFGTTQQKDENIILRLTGQGEEVEVGTFEVGKP